MTLPVVPESSNADRTENNGKTLTWNLGKTLVTGESSKIEAAFRIWNKTAIIATVVVVLVLIGGAVFFFLRHKKPEEQQAIEAPPIDITPNDKN